MSVFQTEITRLPPPHPSKCVESWNETEYEQDVVYTMAVSICYMTEMHYGYYQYLHILGMPEGLLSSRDYQAL